MNDSKQDLVRRAYVAAAVATQDRRHYDWLIARIGVKNADELLALADELGVRR